MDLGAVAPPGPPLQRPARRPPRRARRHGRRAATGRPARGVQARSRRQPGEPLRIANHGDVLEGDPPAVDEARLAGEPDPDHAPAGLDEVDRAAPDIAELEASMTASNVVAGSVSRRQTCANPSERANRADVSRRASRCTSTPRAVAMSAARSPMVPAPTTSTRSPATRPAASTARQALPPGSTRAPRRVVDRRRGARAVTTRARAAAPRARRASRAGSRPRTAPRTGAGGRPGSGRSGCTRAWCRPSPACRATRDPPRRRLPTPCRTIRARSGEGTPPRPSAGRPSRP